MTVQTVQIIQDRIKHVEHRHKIAVFQLPPFIRGDGEFLYHNGFKYTRHHLLDWFDSFFDGMVVSDELIERGHNKGGQLLGVYGASESDAFLVDAYRYQMSQ